VIEKLITQEALMSMKNSLATLIVPVCFFIASCQNTLRVGRRVVAPVATPRPAAPVGPQRDTAVTIDFDVGEAIRTPKSVLILAIGHAEGTINLNGSPTQAYYGHGDSGRRNIGLFSCIACGERSAEEADQYYLDAKIKPLRARFVDSARGALLPANHPMLAGAFFTLLTQSPLAATDRKGFLDRMSTLKAQGISLETLIQLSVDSYRDPDSNAFEDVGRFNNDETLIRADQKRRLVKVEAFLKNAGIDPYPRY